MVFLQRIYMGGTELLLQAAAQQAPVAASPAVDALFDISHDQGIVALGHAVLKQRAEVLPLDVRGVLELVQEEVVVADAQLLVDEGGVGAVDDALEDGVAVVQGHQVLFFLDSREGFPEFRRHAQAVKLAQDGLGGVIFLEGQAEAVEEGP